jgi:2-hydroxychromene-2-carboxylate isomerase
MQSGPIVFHFDFVSPFAYLASTQMDALASRSGRAVDWRPVLVGVLVNQVMKMPSPPELPLKGPYLRRDALRLSEWLGVPFAYHDLPGARSVLALRVFLLLKDRDEQAAVRFANRVFQRLWVDGLDITGFDDLEASLEGLGADVAALRSAAVEPPARAALKRSVDDAIAEGVFGVPFFQVDRQALWGVDRLPMLEHWLEHGSWSRRPSATPEQ